MGVPCDALTATHPAHTDVELRQEHAHLRRGRRRRVGCGEGQIAPVEQHIAVRVPQQPGRPGSELVEHTVGVERHPTLPGVPRRIKLDILAQGGLAVLRDKRSVIPALNLPSLEIGLAGQTEEPPRDGKIEPWSDLGVWNMIATGNARGVHDIESPAMTSLACMADVRDIDRLVAIVSVIRPGAANGLKKAQFARRAQGLEPVCYTHETLAPVLRSTFGVVAYEEHILQICEAFGGLAPGRADVLRRALVKQDTKKIEEATSWHGSAWCSASGASIGAAVKIDRQKWSCLWRLHPRRRRTTRSDSIRAQRAPFGEALQEGADGRFDVSPEALRQLSERARMDDRLLSLIADAGSPMPLRPALNRALVDAWSMTSLPEHTGRPEIEPWLRGWVDDEPQTTIVWRKHLPFRTTPAPSTREIEDYFEAAPIHSSETLETETFRVMGWLRTRAGELREALQPSDVTGIVLTADGRHVQSFRIGDFLEDQKSDKKRQEEVARTLSGRTWSSTQASVA